MKKIGLLILLFLVAPVVYAQTTVEGVQSGTWEKVNSPYWVTDNIIVPTCDTLIIEAGVEVNFRGHYKFTVEGVLLALGSASDSIVFFPDNRSIGWGGIRFENASGISKLEYCAIKFGKTPSADYPDNHGGAAALINSDAVFSHVLFYENQAQGADDGMGGAVYCINTGVSAQTLTKFVNCKFINNYAYGEGGAIKFSGDMNSLVDSCVFIGNNCKYGGGALAFYSVYKTKVKNSLFVENFTEYGNGGTIQVLGSGNLFYVVNSTMYGNEARHGDAGGIYMAYANAEIVNTIVQGNSGMYSDNMFLDFDAYANINYCNVPMPDGATGSNNINADPLYNNPAEYDFTLTPHSPCVDAGTAYFEAENGDVIVNIHEYYGAAPDMGAFEFYPPGDVNENEIPNKFALLQNYPNPFNPTTTISYSIPTPSLIASSPSTAGTQSAVNVALTVYNALGQKVATLVNEAQAPGNYSVQFEAKNMPSGTYFYVLQAGNFTETKKMILLK